MMKISSREITRAALFSALLCITALLFKFGGEAAVPFSIVPLMVLLTGAILGARLGVLSVTVYVLLGLVGLPVFGQPPYGGITYIFQPSFGFLPGFILASYAVGKLVAGKQQPSFGRISFAMLVGIVVYYIIGVTYLYGIIRFYLGKPFTFWQAVEIGMLPFLILDLVKGLLAAMVARGVFRRMRHY